METATQAVKQAMADGEKEHMLDIRIVLDTICKSVVDVRCASTFIGASLSRYSTYGSDSRSFRFTSTTAILVRPLFIHSEFLTF